MDYCPYCGSALLQREYEGDITCLACSRTVSAMPVGLPYVKPSEWRGRKGPKPQAARSTA
jgi:uncharacterized Zn finger protein (UPF0148 family)